MVGGAPDLTLTHAHDLAHHAEAHLLDQVRRLTAATVHTSPAGTHTDHPQLLWIAEPHRQPLASQTGASSTRHTGASFG